MITSPLFVTSLRFVPNAASIRKDGCSESSLRKRSSAGFAALTDKKRNASPIHLTNVRKEYSNRPCPYRSTAVSKSRRLFRPSIPPCAKTVLSHSSITSLAVIPFKNPASLVISVFTRSRCIDALFEISSGIPAHVRMRITFSQCDGSVGIQILRNEISAERK